MIRPRRGIQTLDQVHALALSEERMGSDDQMRGIFKNI